MNLAIKDTKALGGMWGRILPENICVVVSETFLHSYVFSSYSYSNVSHGAFCRFVQKMDVRQRDCVLQISSLF